MVGLRLPRPDKSGLAKTPVVEARTSPAHTIILEKFQIPSTKSETISKFKGQKSK
jgi:hypothetical protein